MLERILRKIILLFYREWNNSTVYSFLLITLMLCLFTVNVLLGINYFIALFISLFLYIALLFIKNHTVQDEEQETDNKEDIFKVVKEYKPLNVTFILCLLLFAFDVWFSTQFPLVVFNSHYSIWWFIFYTIPVFTTSCFSTYFLIISLKKESNSEIYEYKNIRSNEKFELVNTNILQNINHEWIECVLYRSLKDNKLYTREKMDFYDKFEKID